mgnify:FL=1
MPPSKPRDGREFVRMSVDLPRSPKLLDTRDVPRCGWLFTAAVMYSREQRTDGVIRPDGVARYAGVPTRLVRELVRVGMFHDPGHDCDRCVQPPAGHVVVHDYGDHNQTRDEIEQLSEAGKAGAAARWSKGRRGQKPDADRTTDTDADRTSDSHSGTSAEAEAEGESLLLTYVGRLAGSHTRATDRLPAELLDAWRATAPDGVDLVAEARSYLAHYADRPATNERAAWLGWLKNARPLKASKPLGPCAAPECHGGWLPPLPAADRPRP